jgi:ribosomal protein S18 acetylase RimI-like enzyme
LSVDPHYEGQGLDEYLLDWADNRALEALDRVDPGYRVSIRSHSLHENENSINVKLAAGYKQIRHSFRMRIEMEEPPPEPVWPEGIGIRMYNPEKDARTIYEVDEEVFQDHFGFIEEPPDEGFEKFMHHMTGDESYDPTMWYLAVEGDEIVGLCLCRKYGLEDKEAGWISSLGVKRTWRCQGIALGLLQLAFGEFYKRGQKNVGLGVDAESLTGATDLYNKAGMSIQRQFDLFEKEIRPGEEVSVISLETSEK